jgi:hypothetical protein
MARTATALVKATILPERRAIICGMTARTKRTMGQTISSR